MMEKMCILNIGGAEHSFEKMKRNYVFFLKKPFPVVLIVVVHVGNYISKRAIFKLKL